MTLPNHTLALEIDPSRSRMTIEHAALGIRFVSPLPTITIYDPAGPVLLEPASLTKDNDFEPSLETSIKLQGIQYSEVIAGLGLQLEWAFSPSRPLVMWRWSLQNQRQSAVELRHALMMVCAKSTISSRGPDILSFEDHSRARMPDNVEMVFPGELKDFAVFLPGWQSWSYGGWVMAGERTPRSRIRPFTHPQIFDRARESPRTRGHYRSEMFAALVDTHTNIGVVCGFLSQRQSFGTTEVFLDGGSRGLSVRTDLDHVQLDPGQSFSSDWVGLLVGNKGLEVVDDFAALVGELNRARIPDQAPVGWCSWYDYGQGISEEIIEENVAAAVALRKRAALSLIQIDDGFQSEIGDWLTTNANFPVGMQPLSNHIRRNNFIPGLWLAPFIALKNAVAVNHNPEWVLRNALRIPANTGWVWNQFGRAFDPSHPGFLDYLQRVISKVTAEWGFEYLKLDFLYAGVLQGRRYNPNLTRAQAFSSALELIRESAGDSVTLAGCGCPLGPGIGIFDSMRIGPDVAASWKPVMHPFTPLLEREPTLPSAVNSIRNIINRAHFHRRWWINDPDCVLVRKERSELTLEEVQSLITVIGMSGGSVMLSDRVQSLSAERVSLISRLIPPLKGRAQLVSAIDSHDHPMMLHALDDAVGKRWLLACFNTVDDLFSFNIALDKLLSLSGSTHIYDIWRDSYKEHKVDFPLRIEVPGHHVALLAIRQKDRLPSYIGDNVHLSQGGIVKEWSSEDQVVKCRIDPEKKADLRARIFIPGSIDSSTFNGTPITMEKHPDGMAIVELASIDKGELEIHWSREQYDH